MKTESALEQLAATNAFFGVILDKCGNRVLIDVVFSLVSRLNFLRAQSLQYEGWGYLCLQEIEEILAAIDSRNADRGACGHAPSHRLGVRGREAGFGAAHEHARECAQDARDDHRFRGLTATTRRTRTASRGTP